MNKRQIIWLTLFAIAMAHVEASVVVHMRTIYYPNNPQALFPLSILSHRDLGIEFLRELATVVMIGCVALIAASGFTRVFAAFIYVFGLWDIFYYLWLKLMLGWPVSWSEWDVLFLIPWPWFGPWIAAALIALLLVIGGGWILLRAGNARFTRATALTFVVGMLLALAAFLLPAVPLLPGGEEAFRNYQPQTFCWRCYIPGYLMMAVSLWWLAGSGRRAQGSLN
jgi:hypothetical protein